MINYKFLNKKLNKLENKYIENINKFNKIFPIIGNLNFYNYNQIIIHSNKKNQEKNCLK